MKKLLIALLVLPVACAAQTVYVRPYVNNNGQYVQGHYRSDANATRVDNYSAQGNVNPWTGAQGSRQVQPNYGYRPPQPIYQPQPIQPPATPWQQHQKQQGYR